MPGAHKVDPDDRWQRSFFAKFILYQRSVFCQSSSYICQRHLTTSLCIKSLCILKMGKRGCWL